MNMRNCLVSVRWIAASCLLSVMPPSAFGGGKDAPKFEDPSFVPAPPQEVKDSAPNAYRILFVGNSITRHAIVLDPLKWDHEAGMAASCEANDYAHRFGALVQRTMPERKVELLFGNVNERLLKKGEAVSFGNRPPPDLVIIQTGEHEGPGKSKAEIAAVYEKSLIKPYHDQSPRPLIICAGIWCPNIGGTGGPYGLWVRDVNDAYRDVCAKYQIPFASVESVAQDPSCNGWGEHPGVKWHPNDKGMDGYARLLFEAYCHKMGLGTPAETARLPPAPKKAP